MNVQTALQFGGLISVIVGLASLLNGIMSIRRQMTLQIIMKYTERYEQIMSKFPESSLSFRVNACNLPQQDPSLTVSVLKYLNLCSEEYYLRNKRYFAKNVRKLWELDMTRMVASPL